MTEVDPSARIQVRQPGQLMHPGCCSLCGFGGVERNYVDPAIWYDYEGQQYFCTDCTTQMGEAIGMCSAGEFAHLKDLYERSAAKLRAQEEELNALRTLRDSILDVASDSLRAALIADVTDATVSGALATLTDQQQPEPESADGDEPVNVDDAGPGTVESSEPNESGEGEGPDDAARITVSDTSGRKPVRKPLI